MTVFSKFLSSTYQHQHINIINYTNISWAGNQRIRMILKDHVTLETKVMTVENSAFSSQESITFQKDFQTENSSFYIFNQISVALVSIKNLKKPVCGLKSTSNLNLFNLSQWSDQIPGSFSIVPDVTQL